MTEKRYYEKDYEEEYYIFDSQILSEEEFEERVEYDDYAVFADSLTPKEVIDLLNENEELKRKHYNELMEEGVKIERLREENEELKKENNDLKTSKEYWREKCLSKDSYNKLYHKAPIWFTQELKLTNKEVNKVAEAIKQDLKQRRMKE